MVRCTRTESTDLEHIKNRSVQYFYNSNYFYIGTELRLDVSGINLYMHESTHIYMQVLKTNINK